MSQLAPTLFNPQAEAGTLHVLKSRYSMERRSFEWTGTTWSTPKTKFGTKPGAMTALGWEYERPEPCPVS